MRLHHCVSARTPVLRFRTHTPRRELLPLDSSVTVPRCGPVGGARRAWNNREERRKRRDHFVNRHGSTWHGYACTPGVFSVRHGGSWRRIDGTREFVVSK